MKQEIDQSDVNKMNNLIFKKIKEQFEKDLTDPWRSTRRFLSK